jgi:hypothetical protein
LTLPSTSYSAFYVDCGARCVRGKKSPKLATKSKRFGAFCLFLGGTYLAEKSPIEDVKEISDRLLSSHMQRLNKDLAAVFGPPKVEHHPILSNAEPWPKPKDKR